MSDDRLTPGQENGQHYPPPSLSLELSLSRPAVLPQVHEDEPLYVLLRVRAGGPDRPDTQFRATLVPGDPLSHIQTPGGHAEFSIQNRDARSPFHLGLILDASGSMHRMMLEEWERERWREVGEERGDLKRGRVDGREGWLWSGRTLTELQAQHRTPMQAALRALLRAGERLGPDDSLQVIAFADRARELVPASAADRSAQIRAAAALLSQGVEASGLGDGTRLADALRMALAPASSGVRLQSPGGQKEPETADVAGLTSDASRLPPTRLLLVSDGLLEDRVACGAWLERIAEAGIPLGCIGVGDQFDEEWLMGAADTTRGRFRYAPTADALETAVADELARLEALAARRVSLELRPLGGALFRDLCQAAPELSALHRMETDGTVFRFALGDFSWEQEALFLVELALPALPPGRHPVLVAAMTGETARGEPLHAPATEAVVSATAELGSVVCDPADLEVVAVVHAYRAERRAQRAMRRGQLREATRHLRDTRQIVQQLGRSQLADELKTQADAIETGSRLSPEGVKRIKAGTRQLMTPAAAERADGDDR